MFNRTMVVDDDNRIARIVGIHREDNRERRTGEVSSAAHPIAVEIEGKRPLVECPGGNSCRPRCTSEEQDLPDRLERRSAPVQGRLVPALPPFRPRPILLTFLGWSMGSASS